MTINARIRPWLIAAALLVVALLPRLFGLDRFLTSDENTNIFFAGSDVIAAFLAGDLAGTYWHFYPGVTMSWLDAIGMVGQYLLDSLRSSPPPFADYIYGDILSLLVANRLPYAVLTALAVPAVYLLARQLLPGSVALLGALFIAFDPFFLAHSRVAHGDAPVAVFMCLSALTFFVYAQRRQGITPGPFFDRSTFAYLIASAILGSLAALTKAPGQFMALFVVGASALLALLELRRSRSAVSRTLLHWLGVIVIWGGVSLVVFVLLWPAMWVDPFGTFGRMLNETFGKVNEGHLVYFRGQPTLDPGPWFYPYVIPFRLTPVVLIGCLLSLVFFFPKAKAKLPDDHSPQLSIINYQLSIALLWLFVISLLLFGNLSPKKQDRYLLPLFPFLDLIAAVGWSGALLFLNETVFGRKAKLSIINYQLSIIIILHLLPTFTYYPYYLTYFNPLLGGPTKAAQETLMGWGEGMEQVAAYLNDKPNAADLYVASTPSQTLLPYFAGTGENFYTNDIALRADYVVLYLAQMQRLAPSPEIVRYFQSREPEQVITIKGVPYAHIYPGPKLIASDLPLEATPLNIGLEDLMRLAGYTISSSQASGLISNQEDNPIQLTLYWHALAPISSDYTVSVRAKDAAGQIIDQQDQWPADGLLPTSQWRPGDYVTDSHRLDLPPDAPPVSAFEIVVYDAVTGQTLGPPITLPNQP